MANRAQARLYQIIEKGRADDVASRLFDGFILTLIALNVVMVILETVPELAGEYGVFFNTFEAVSVLVFTVEYALRIWTCVASPHFTRPLWGRLAFMLTPLALIDLIAIFPYYLFLMVSVPADYTLPLRLLRLFRLFKIGRYSRSMQLLGAVLWRKRDELYVVAFVLTILLVLVSSLMYFVEHQAQPEGFASIPSTMWWGIVTLTTVGYGDVFPITPLGKFLGAFIAILGVGMFALPAGILSAVFIDALAKTDEETTVCPHCGKAMDEDHEDV